MASGPGAVNSAAELIGAGVWDGGEFIVLDAPAGMVWTANGEHSWTVGGYGQYEEDAQGRLFKVQRKHLWAEALECIRLGVEECPASCSDPDECPEALL